MISGLQNTVPGNMVRTCRKHLKSKGMEMAEQGGLSFLKSVLKMTLFHLSFIMKIEQNMSLH